MIRSLFLCGFCCALVGSARADELNFKLEKDDHICIIGNTLAERMQHDGWLETRLHARHSEHRLVIRNLGFSGDEIDPNKRLRSKDFGSPDEWLAGSSRIPQPKKLPSLENIRQNRFELTETRADVIFAFFGYNESWGGEAGLNDFRVQLDRQLRHMLSKHYNGKTAPRIVLFSPTAFEDLKDPNLPNGEEHNARLAVYTSAMSEVAAANGVFFVNIYEPTRELFSTKQGPFTINGVHLTAVGNQAVAEIIDRILFGASEQSEAEERASRIKAIHAAVRDKNWHWFQRYRATDGFSTYGDRAFLAFTDNRTNYEVGQRELEVLDVMTANRDRACWAAAQGETVVVDDSNVPPFLEVRTNKPGALPDGRHEFLSGEKSVEAMTLGTGLQVNLFASEEQFPELINPAQMAWDTYGRLWVTTWASYPHWKPLVEEMNDKLLILEDTDNDGRADKCKVFADKLHNPTGFEFYGGGVLVATAPDVYFLKDTDGDDSADQRERILHGLDTADTHHGANSFVLDPGGSLYFQEGTFHHSQVESVWGPPRRLANAGVFRFEPRSQKFDIYASYAFANPHGHVFDTWGQDFVTDGTSAQTYWGTAFSGHLNFPDKHPRMHTVYAPRTRPCPGSEIISSRHFPEEWQGDLIIPNVIGFQGLMRYKLKDEGSGFSAVEQEPMLFSSDVNFRPVDVEVAPDGALYFTDWQNPIIGHLQHNLRDPNRDKSHGRVYRLTYRRRELLEPVAIANQEIDALLEALKEPANRERYRAKIELSGRKSEEVVAKLADWIAQLDKRDANFEHHRLEGLWVYQYHNVVNEPLLGEVLNSPDFRARAAAARVLLSWRDRISDPLAAFKKLASDDHPRVRLEAVRAASFFTTPDAYEILLIARAHPTDYYLDYVHKESSRILEPLVKQALLANMPLAFSSEAGQRYLLRRKPVEILMADVSSPAVCVELVHRPGLTEEQRLVGLQGLAERSGNTIVGVLLSSLSNADENSSLAGEGVLFDWMRLLAKQGAATIESERAAIAKLAATAKRDVVRQIAFAVLMQHDGTTDKVLPIATKSKSSKVNFLNSLSLHSDSALQASAYAQIEMLLKDHSVEVRHAAMNALTSIRGHELQHFVDLISFLDVADDRSAAIDAIQRIPSSAWPKERAQELAEKMVAILTATPIKERNSKAALAMLEFGYSLASLLPADQGKAIRQQLDELGVRVIRIGSVFERMAYDQQTLVVEAGKPVEFIFENRDLMPHNFVIAAPGALEELGQLAEKTALSPDAAERHYVPKSPKVLLGSRLLGPRATQKLSFIAPKKSGVYPYVCTYPGHWRRMYGALYIVEDLNGYFADPDGYLASANLPVIDQLLKDRRPRTEWKVSDLTAAVAEQGSTGRSYAIGKQLFTTASCTGCHRLGCVGQQFGPELTKLDPLWTPQDVLLHILEPSRKVDDKYKTNTFQLEDGTVLSGLIIEEDANQIKLVENPLTKIDPVIIPREEIAARQTQKLSPMPKGLLDRLGRDEILDLLAYVVAGGNPEHEVFAKGQGGHEHNH